MLCFTSPWLFCSNHFVLLNASPFSPSPKPPPITVSLLSSHSSSMFFSLTLNVCSSLFYFTERKDREAISKEVLHVLATKFTSLPASLPTRLPASLPPCLPAFSSLPALVPVSLWRPGPALGWRITGSHLLKALASAICPTLFCIMCFSLSFGTLVSVKKTLAVTTFMLFFNFLFWEVSNSQKINKNNTISTCLPFTYIYHLFTFCLIVFSPSFFFLQNIMYVYKWQNPLRICCRCHNAFPLKTSAWASCEGSVFLHSHNAVTRVQESNIEGS